MAGRFIGFLEVVAALLALLAIGRFATGADPDFTTAGMVALVTAVWLAYRVVLHRWLRARPWLNRTFDAAEVPAPLAEGVRRVEASTVEFNGARWRTGSSATELGNDGPRATAMRLPALLVTGQGVLISLGLIGTFLGLTLGLMSAVPKLTAGDHAAPSAGVEPATHGASIEAGPTAAPPTGPTGEQRIAGMQEGMEDLLGGARLAFAKSVAGVAFAMLWGLRLRQAESRRDDYLDALADDLDARWPLLTAQQVQLHAASELARSNALLTNLLASADAERVRVHLRAENLRETVAQLGGSVEKRADELVMTMQELAESLPASIGSQTGSQVLQLLAPQFGALVNEMKKLTEGGSKQISKAMIEQADAEVSGLKRALGDIVTTLDRLPADYKSRMDEVQSGMRGAMVTVGTTVSGASADLGEVSQTLQATLAAIGRILPEVQAAATGLRGAGEQVREGLQGVAGPLLGLPPALDATRIALEGAADALSASEAALESQSEGARAMVTALAAQERGVSAGTTRAEALVAQIERLREALRTSEVRLGDLTAAQATANGTAVAELGRSLVTFQAALEGVQRSMKDSSEGALRTAESVSLEAAKRVAEALGRGAGDFESAMQRLVAHSTAMEASLQGARDTAAALGAQAAKLRDGVAEVATPLGPIANALSAVPASVQSAALALRTEQLALQGLGQNLREQAAALKTEHEGVSARIEQYKQLNALLGREMNLHLQGITAANAQVKAAWAEAVAASHAVIEGNALQLGRFAQEVQDKLRLPGDLRRLDQTVEELTGVLDDLRTALTTNHLSPDGDTDRA